MTWFARRSDVMCGRRGDRLASPTRMFGPKPLVALASCLVALLSSSLFAFDVRVAEPWSDVFGGQDATFHCLVIGDAALRGRIAWTLRAGNATLARQERELVVAPGAAATTEVRLQMPEAKEGVVADLALAFAVFDANGKQVGACVKPVFLFPSDAFQGRKEWFRDLHVRVFDPEKKTAGRLTREELAFELVANADTIADMTNGVLIVGEGVSFKDYRGLWGDVVRAAARGTRVLCLAPAAGSIDLPLGAGSDLPRATSFQLRDQTVIHQLDKRLDAVAWPPDGRTCASGLAIQGERGPVVAEVVAPDQGWPWLDLEFPGGRGRVIVYTFAVVDKWETGPAPRFLLTRILEYLAGSP